MRVVGVKKSLFLLLDHARFGSQLDKWILNHVALFGSLKMKIFPQQLDSSCRSLEMALTESFLMSSSRFVTVHQLAMPRTTIFLFSSIDKAFSLNASPTSFIQPLFVPPVLSQASRKEIRSFP